MYCAYYQAIVRKERCWQFTAILRSYEHLVFDRTIDVDESRLEFFVPHDLEPWFLEVMAYFEREQIVSHLQKMENRIAQERSSVDERI